MEARSKSTVSKRMVTLDCGDTIGVSVSWPRRPYGPRKLELFVEAGDRRQTLLLGIEQAEELSAMLRAMLLKERRATDFEARNFENTI